MNGKCTIVANGSFPLGAEALTVLEKSEYICCCDGAVEKLTAAGFVPSSIIGDGDSISEHMKHRYSHIFIKIDEQEYNDLTKATKHCVQLGYTTIYYLGATGLREDHTIGNIFLLPYYLNTFGITPIMITDDGEFTVHRGDATIASTPGQQISVFNIDCSLLESEGLRWSIYPFTQLWQGTLNEATAHTFTVKADGTYLIYKSFSR